MTCILRRLLFVTSFILVPFLTMAHDEKAIDKNQETNAAEPTEEFPDIIMGSDKAPLILVEYSSINCTHCAAFHNKAFAAFKKTFIDTGKVQLIYRHFPLDYGAVEAMSLIADQPKSQWFSLIETAYDNQKDWVGQDPEKLGHVLNISAKSCAKALSCEPLKESIMAKRFHAEQLIDIQATPTFQIFYQEKGVAKNILINEGIAPKSLHKKLHEAFKKADKS